jgi:hypothetical protein
MFAEGGAICYFHNKTALNFCTRVLQNNLARSNYFCNLRRGRGKDNLIL